MRSGLTRSPLQFLSILAGTGAEEARRRRRTDSIPKLPATLMSEQHHGLIPAVARSNLLPGSRISAEVEDRVRQESTRFGGELTADN